MPDKPTIKISGILRYDRMRTSEVELFGQAGNLISFSAFHTIIHGTTLDGKTVTLHSCHLTHERFQQEVGSVTYRLLVIFEGRHFRDLEAIAFDSIKLGYSNLEQWIGHNPFSIANEGTTESLDLRCSVSGFKKIAFTINNALFCVEPEADYHVKIREKATLRYGVSIKISTEHSLAYIEWGNQFIVPLKNFFTLGMASEAVPTSLSATCDGDKVRMYLRDDLHSEHQNNVYMLFPYSEIKEYFPELLTAWFRLSKPERLGPACDLFFEVLNSRYVPLEHQFLTLTQALEAFHRRSDLTNEIKGVKLDKRIQELLEITADIRKCLKEGDKDDKSFIADDVTFNEEVTKTRHFMTH